jgi:hypothetical protein
MERVTPLEQRTCVLILNKKIEQFTPQAAKCADSIAWLGQILYHSPPLV